MRESLRPTAKFGAASLLAAAIGGFACFAAFNTKPAKQIWNRALGVSEISGKCRQAGYILERAHLSHARNDYYQSPGNGLFVTAGEHYILHNQLYGMTGLTSTGEDYAIEQIKNRITPREEQELEMAGFVDGEYQPRLVLWKDPIPPACKDCLARIPYPFRIRSGLIEMSSICLVKKMMEIGTPPDGLRDFCAKVPKPRCPLQPQVNKYIQRK